MATSTWGLRSGGVALTASRWYRPAILGLSLGLLTVGAAVWAPLVALALGGGGGVDVRVVQDLGSRWLETGSMYLPYQLAGPYAADVQPLPALYPPAAGPLFAAVALVPLPLATAVSLAVPVAVVAWAVVRWRPAPWAWPVMALSLALPTTAVLVLNAGTSLWVAAAVAASLSGVRPLSALALLKPTFLPLALLGVRSRAWWASAVAVAALTVVGPWRDYLVAAANARGLDYQLWSAPLVLLPIVAWAARRRRTQP